MANSDDGDIGYHELTDEEIAARTREIIEEQEEEEEEKEKETSPTVSHTQACHALEIVLMYVEQQPGIQVSTTVMLNSVLVEATRKQSVNIKETKITDYISKITD